MTKKSGEVLCPRCKTDYFTPYGVDRTPDMARPPALSRVIDTHICPACGEDEGLRDLRGLAPIPPGEWPVTQRLVMLT